MDFIKVDKSNIDILYNLNRELAFNEGQSSLFSADKREYIDAFCGKNPMVYAFLVYNSHKLVGFCIYFEKFATYLASKVLFIEDLYLRKSNYLSKDDILDVLSYIQTISKSRNCKRVEMRVLKRYSIDTKLLEKSGFKKIDKWDVYRYEN